MPHEPLIASDGGLAIRRLRDDDADYALLVRWRSMPHVREWWDPDDPPPTLDEIRSHYGPRTDPSRSTTACVIELAGGPVGYVQFYRWADEITGGPDDMDIPLDDDPWGLDIMIGEPDLAGTGIGSRTVALLCDSLHRERGATTVLLDTELANLRAQRAYEKAGFRKVRHILDTDTRDGERVWCWLMAWTAPTPTS